MNKFIAGVLMLIIQFVLISHGISIFTWEWWVLTLCMIFYGLFTNEEN